MVQAAVIQQPGKVELHAIPDGVPPIYLRFMRPRKPLYVTMKEYENISPTTSLDIETIKLVRHRVAGLSVEVAYWPDSWQDAWAIEELLRWEGREDEIRRDKYYAEFVSAESETSQRDWSDAPGARLPLVSGEAVGTGSSSLRIPESKDILRLEKGPSGGYSADLSGEDGE